MGMPPLFVVYHLISSHSFRLFNIDSYHLMKEFGYGDGNLRGFFAHLGFEFDQNGNFILPFESPALDIPNKVSYRFFFQFYLATSRKPSITLIPNFHLPHFQGYVSNLKFLYSFNYCFV